MKHIKILSIILLIGVQAVFSQSLDSLSIDKIISAADSIRQEEQPKSNPAQDIKNLDSLGMEKAISTADSVKQEPQPITLIDPNNVLETFIMDRQDLADDIKRLLARDTTTQGYKNRIEYVRGFIDSITGEQQKKFERTIEVLKDYIVENEARIVKETPKTAQLKLGLYDSESEQYQVIVQDTANTVSPFLFAGRLNVPASLAVAMDSNATGFSVNVWRLSNPFQSDSQSVNLAFTRLTAYRNNIPFVAEGNFYYLPRYKSMPGFAEWKQRNDSLLNGTLRLRGYDLDYAISGEFDKGKSSWGWFGWAKFLVMSAAVVCGSLSGYEYFLVRDEESAVDILVNNEPALNARRSGDGEYLHPIWQKKYSKHSDNLRDRESRRDRFRNAGIGLGVLGVTMIVFDYAF